MKHVKQQNPLEAAFEEALAEIGPIRPRWASADGVYVFDHPAYPFVAGGGPTRQEAVESYQRALFEFIADRLQGTLSHAQDRLTPGRGGARPGAGRPRKPPTQMIRLPVEIVDWLKADPNNLEALRQLMGEG